MFDLVYYCMGIEKPRFPIIFGCIIWQQTERAYQFPFYFVFYGMIRIWKTLSERSNPLGRLVLQRVNKHLFPFLSH